MECYRIYEACEVGSIPIVEDFESEETPSCKHSTFPFKQSGAPFIFVKSWDNIESLLEHYLKDKKALQQRQRDLLEWYQKFKEDLIIDFENRLDSLIH